MGTVVGIDVGGTFTDLVYADDRGNISLVLKVPSTPDDPARGVLDALVSAQVDMETLGALLHGTTIATNAVIERTGARCALVTTRGFRDVLELGRRDRINLYGLTGVQQPLIDRSDRWEIDERIDYQGRVITPVDDEAVATLAEHLKETGVAVVVIALLHSYANSLHEERVAEIFRRANPDWHIVMSSAVVSEYYEFERTSTAVVQGYLQPLVSQYASELLFKLSELGMEREALVVQSNGGVIPLKRLGSRASHIIRSGPAAGVMAATKFAREVGFNKIITADMGGTSFDVALVVDGEPRVSESTELGFRVPLRIPMMDIETIGAGGGSIAWIDKGGTLQVGPRSAGAVPGPVSFRRGGSEPTVTDANVILGRIDASQPIGHDVNQKLDLEGARRSLAELGERLDLEVEEVADAILAVVNVRMASRMRLISVDQGYDPRDFAMVAFGGAGPLHAAALMRDVGVKTLLVPPRSGVLCAEGCIAADLRYDYSQTVERRVDSLGEHEFESIFERQRQRGHEELALDGGELARIDEMYFADMAYLGQVHKIRVRLEPTWDREAITKAFVAAYVRDFGSTLGNIPTLIVNVRTSVRGIRRRVVEPINLPPDLEVSPPEKFRRVYFDRSWMETAIYRRESLLPGMRFTGPAVVEQDDTTTIIEPGMVVWVDGRSNLQIEIG